MGGIPYHEREFAMVHRLASQMPFYGAAFKATECYAAFNTILCWTLQRIRSRHHPLNGLRDTLRTKDITSFCGMRPHPYDDGQLGAEDETHGAQLDDLSVLKTNAGQPIGTLEALVSLRNSVAHPDDLRVYPINRRGWLIGFRFECQKPGNDCIHRWENDANYTLYLTRHGMTPISQALASGYCTAFTQADLHVEAEAAEIGEV